ncbi:hypothetical protein PV516_01095 [Streptomyces scabiei]|uniref:hypothetical protein n=1 Tax=Streptomyces scabiei TaxID=1930 RepID=UPI0029ADF613|nr:hypothetical protein [Streptomyces scabiei]MDX3162396.1 hypothetical protein [Streptomyces scabiei]
MPKSRVRRRPRHPDAPAHLVAFFMTHHHLPKAAATSRAARARNLMRTGTPGPIVQLCQPCGAELAVYDPALPDEAQAADAAATAHLTSCPGSTG